MDARTGQILHSTNDTSRLHPASLTKMMTLYVTFEAVRNGEISLDTMVTVSRRAASEPPSRLGLRTGQRIALRHLIRAAALRSGNDAATAIAEAVSGSVEAFAQRMTRTGVAMGMTSTTFRNAHGLTAAGHLSTARDMTLLGRQLYFDFPEYYGIFSRRSEDAGIAQVNNTNGRFLAAYRGADGIKTGFTNAAGYNLTAMAERNGVRLIVTVFGGRSVQHRHEQVVALMDRGFRAAPARAAIRRPGRPNYSRPAPATVAAQGSTRTPAPTESRAAGRVIRLQTAPPRSIFPQRRPVPGDAPAAAPAPELLAALQTGIGAALAELAEPDAADPDMPDAAPTARARGAVAQSLLPRNRPAAILALASATPADAVEADIQAARAAGFSVIDPETLADVLTPADEAPSPVIDVAMVAEAAPPAVVELPPRALAPPAERPPALVSAHHAPDAATQTASTADADADDTDAGTRLAALPASVTDAEHHPGVTLAPERFSTVELAAVVVEDGLVIIPGLPPIPLANDDAEMPGQTFSAPLSELALAPSATDHATGHPEPVLMSEPGLVVTAGGRILWHDDDLLEWLDEMPPVAVGPSPIVMTSTETMDPAPAPSTPMGDVVVRVSTSGGQMWGVDLGRYASRFDAERTLLRIALAESASLSGGVRRVVERGGGYGALIVSLSQEQADRACLRLGTGTQACTVVAP